MAGANAAYYEQQRRNINTGAAREYAANEYARFLARQRGRRQRQDIRTDFRYNRGDVNTDYRYGRENASRSYNRNLQDYQRGLDRYSADRTLAYQRGYSPLAASYGARGLNTGGVTSGVTTAGMNEYSGDYRRDITRAQQDFSRATGRSTQDYQRALARLLQGRDTYLGRLGERRDTGIGRSRVDTAQEMNQYDLNRANIRSDAENARKALRAQRARERALTAQYLTALQPYLT